MPLCWRSVAIVLATCALSACANLPRGAAVQSEILETSDTAQAEFAVYAVTRDFLPSVALWPVVGTQARGWITQGAGGVQRQTLRAGDRVDLRIWDSNESSLLTGAGQRSVDLPGMRVTPQGEIFVPYVGDVRVAGLSPERARAEVQVALEAIAPSAQVQLQMGEGRGNSVDLVGGVQTPGSYPLPDQTYSILSLIAAGGGPRSDLANPQVRLQRGAQVFGTSLARLYAEPGLDTRLRGGDQVFIEEDDRYFLSLGATGQEALHAFPKDRVSAMDALSIVGGVQDSRGDPQGILVLREYPRDALRPGADGPRQERVVFTLDLTSADGLFSARNFAVHSGDLIMATESPVSNVRTVLGLIGSAFGVLSAVGN